MSPATARFILSLDKPLMGWHRAALARESMPCNCGEGYCAAHGHGEPRVTDAEVLELFVAQSARPSNHRVIRKPLEH